MTQILLVEDDPGIVRNLSEFLRNEGFCVDAVSGQAEAMEIAGQREYDLALVDVSLSNGNGFAVCSGLRKAFSVPVIFLTASSDEYSVVTGLELGADDYIAKPFRPRELVSRIRNVLRRTGKSQTVIEIGALQVDTNRGAAFKNGCNLNLSALEYRLLLTLLNNRGIILSRSRLLDEIWDVAGDFVNDNTLTVYIKRLRDKIEDDPQNPRVIRTVRGQGYRVEE